MTNWTVGKIKVTRIEETVVLFPLQAFLPSAKLSDLRNIEWLGEPHVTDEGELRLIIQAFVIETPESRIIVDTCMGNDKPRRWTAANMLNTEFLTKLSVAGYPRETLDVVLCTHLHVDHVGWNTMLQDGRWTPTFPRARYLFGKREFAHWQDQRGEQDAAVFDDSVRPVMEAGLADLVEPDHIVDPWVRLISTPGHTPGHVSVHMEDNGERGLITGDAFHSPAQIARPDWASIADVDPVASTQTRRQILSELAASQTRMFGTHFPEPTVGTISRNDDNYRFIASEELLGREVQHGQAPVCLGLGE